MVGEPEPTGAVGRRPVATDRRTFLKVAGAGGAGLVFSSAPGAPAAAAAAERCYVVVLDGLRPDEVSGGSMPTVQALRRQGLDFPRARALPVTETLPNHVMMMTGVRPDRNGVPANEVYDRGLGEVRTMDRPGDIRVTTLIEALSARGLSTGTVLSKEYLFDIFGARATHRWEPRPVVPVSGHAPDAFTMDATVTMVRRFDPRFVFVNLGDVDRLGHTDLTGTTLRAARTAALAATDLQVRRLVRMLQRTGRWERSMLLFVADHSMDWSVPGRVVSLAPLLEADPLLAGRVAVAQNGGADLLYWTGPARRRTEAVARMRRIALAHPGVLAAHDRRAERHRLRLGARAGDVVAYCRAGWRFSDPHPLANPIPGNHGHPSTEPIPFFLTGGHPDVPRGTSTAPASTVDVAPTVARFLGVDRTARPRGGWDGRARL